MPVSFKKLDAQTDIKTQTFASVNSLISVTGQTDATTNNVSIYSIGPFTGSYIYKPDIFGSTTAGISPSGAINSFTKQFFNYYDPARYYNSTYNVYVLPASHSGNLNVVVGRLIEVAQPTRGSGIWPDSFTGVFTYNSTTLTAIDSSIDSFGTNKESLTYGKLTEINNPNHVVGSIFYDDGMVLLHGGTGAASAFTSYSVSGFAFRGSITGALTSSVSATHIIAEKIQFQPYNMLARNIYFCWLKPDEFNYTSNPSAQNVAFLQRQENSTVYITTIGLYDDKQNLLALGKISPPLRKNFFLGYLLRVVVSI